MIGFRLETPDQRGVSIRTGFDHLPECRTVRLAETATLRQQHRITSRSQQLADTRTRVHFDPILSSRILAVVVDDQWKRPLARWRVEIRFDAELSARIEDRLWRLRFAIAAAYGHRAQHYDDRFRHDRSILHLVKSSWLSRAFIAGAIAAAAMTTITAAPQTQGTQASKKLPIVAFLGGNRAVLDWVVGGLRDIGYFPERDFHLEARLTEGRPETEAQFAAEIVTLHPSVVVATVNAALELKKRTSVLPILLTNTPENIGLRMMDSLEHPGGNVTGVVERPALRNQKTLSLLKEIVPGLSRVAVLTAGYSIGAPLQSFAAANGLQLDIADFRSAVELERAFDKLAANSPQALFVGGGPLILANISKIASLAASRKWPSINENRELPQSGGLMSYGGFGDARQVAQYVDRILKGAKPGELAAEVRPLHWDLVINLNSAKQLGLTIPDSVLAQAAEIIR